LDINQVAIGGSSNRSAILSVFLNQRTPANLPLHLFELFTRLLIDTPRAEATGILESKT
jgi:hypothetical protein